MEKDIQVIRDADRIKVSLEETREKILELLRINDMTISQLAEALNKDQSTINRHIKKLQEAGFVEITGERKKHHIPERKYGRSADGFILNPDGQNPKKMASLILRWVLNFDKSTLERLDELGYENPKSDIFVEEIYDFFYDLNHYIISQIDLMEEDFLDMSFDDLLKLKILIYMVEIKKNPEVRDRFKEIVSEFDELE